MGQNVRTKALLLQLAGGREGANLERLLSPGRVNICIDVKAAREPQGQLVFSFAANLLCRLHPVIQHLTVTIPDDVTLYANVPRWTDKTLGAHVHQMLSSVGPPLAWNIEKRPDVSAAVSLVIGLPVHITGQLVFIGSSGWVAYLSPFEPVQISGPPNPVGAYAAGCLGVAEIWKRLLQPHRGIFDTVPIIPQTEPLAFSTLTYLPNSAGENPALPDTINLNRLTMTGLGAGGGASAYTLASFHHLAGRINTIDPDETEETNLNRYVFADSVDAHDRRLKVDIVQDFLRRFLDLTVVPLPEPFTKVASVLRREDFEYVLAAVHSRAARREIQQETPKVLWDAGATEDGEFRVWRHVLGVTECMYCKHPLGEDDPDDQKAQQVAQLLGLDPAICLVKIRDHALFTGEEVTQIQTHLTGQTITFDLPYPGQRFNDWETEQCGRLTLPELDDGVPIPFAPIMAGVLLAGEVIKQQYFPQHVLDSRYWNTLLGRFLLRARPYCRAPTVGCSFCSDPVYIDQYRRRWTRHGSR